MKKVVVLKNGVEAFGTISEDPASWIEDCIANDYWGKKERTLFPEQFTTETVEAALEVVDVSGIDGVRQAYKFPCEYEVTILDESQTDIYKSKRAAEYPSVLEYLDGLVKSNSGDSVVAANGVAQMNKYIQDCLAVKTKYPKPS